jgi:hypothetical protein
MSQEDIRTTCVGGSESNEGEDENEYDLLRGYPSIFEGHAIQYSEKVYFRRRESAEVLAKDYIRANVWVRSTHPSLQHASCTLSCGMTCQHIVAVG